MPSGERSIARTDVSVESFSRTTEHERSTAWRMARRLDARTTKLAMFFSPCDIVSSPRRAGPIHRGASPEKLSQERADSLRLVELDRMGRVRKELDAHIRHPRGR